MNNDQTFFFNGHEFFIDRSLTLHEILRYFNYQNGFFIVEYNNLICNQNDWTTIKINPTDKIEIITIVGGG